MSEKRVEKETQLEQNEASTKRDPKTIIKELKERINETRRINRRRLRHFLR